MADVADLCDQAERAYEAVEAGRFDGIAALADALSSANALSPSAHALALGAHAFFAGLSYGVSPTLEVATRLGRAGAFVSAPLSRYILLAQRERLLAFDADGVCALGEVAKNLEPADERTRVRVALARCWGSALTDVTPETESALRTCFDDARRAGLAALAIDIQSTLAIAKMRTGDLVEATRISRRASRMARTEALPQQEYLAHLLLSRVRRLNGVPHLSLHILNALVAIAPTPYQPWIRWERLLAGSIVGDPPDGDASPADRAARALDRQMTAAARGDKSVLTTARASLFEAVQSFPLVCDEARDYSVALDPLLSPSDASPAMRRWLTGEAPLPPHGLYGARAVALEIGESVADAGFLVAGPDQRARRVLGAAAPLVGFVSDGDEESQRRRARTETGLAVLAFHAPEPMPLAVFFRSVYGFELNPEVHLAVLNTLVSRMRSAVGDAGVIIRGDADLSVRFRVDTALPDPRCAQPLEDRVLRVLVRMEAGTAKDAADRLGVPLRRIQEALKELTEGGACLKQRAGRQIAYVVEDTTFSPPTRV